MGWRDILLRAWGESTTDDVGMIAAGVAFYGFLALVPLLGAIVLTYGLVANPATVANHARGLFELLPKDAAGLIADQMVKLSRESAGKTGLGLVMALGISLYGGMRGASAVVTVLNIAYDEEERRGFVRTSLLALAITVGAVVIGVLGVMAIGALAFLEALLPAIPPLLLMLVRVAFWFVAAIAASFAVAALYRYGPDRNEAQWRWLTPGAVLATVGWLVMTLGFAVYTANFANYDATYGALGAVVVLLMWLYLSAYILIFGAELNAEIEHQTAIDTTSGTPQPMGTRDAYVADTLGEVPAGPFGGKDEHATAKASMGIAASRTPDRSASRPVASLSAATKSTANVPHSASANRQGRGFKTVLITLGLICVADALRHRPRRGSRAG